MLLKLLKIIYKWFPCLSSMIIPKGICQFLNKWKEVKRENLYYMRVLDIWVRSHFISVRLTRFKPMFPLKYPLKIGGFLMLSEGKEWDIGWKWVNYYVMNGKAVTNYWNSNIICSFLILISRQEIGVFYFNSLVT